jgi:hypothetical protein
MYSVDPMNSNRTSGNTNDYVPSLEYNPRGGYSVSATAQADAYFVERLDAMAGPACTVFVGDLSYFCGENDLGLLFGQYGAIMAAKVRRGITGESLMHGFVTFDNPEAARRSVADLNGIEFLGRNMR